MKNFRTYQIAIKFYHCCNGLPLKGDARDQLARAARSIVLNLAEGRGRRTTKDQVRFFQIAFASLRECQAVLDLECLSETELRKLADKLAAHLYRLIQNAE